MAMHHDGVATATANCGRVELAVVEPTRLTAGALWPMSLALAPRQWDLSVEAPAGPGLVRPSFSLLHREECLGDGALRP
jgi:hypothetical protein